MTDHQFHEPTEGGTTSELHSIVRFKFHEGKVEEFKRLSATCMEIVRTQDPGTLQYDTFFNEDESECIVLERFRDLESLMQHGANIGDELMEAIVATGECFGELLGAVPAELRASLAGGPVQVFLPYLAL
jgi:quinol monooxygenase YgiN